MFNIDLKISIYIQENGQNLLNKYLEDELNIELFI